MATTAQIVLDTRREKKGKKYPVKLQVTHERTARNFATGIDLTETDFKKVYSNRAKGELLETRELLDGKVQTAKEIISKLQPFSFTAFKLRFVVGVGEHSEVFYRFRRRIAEMESKEQHSNARIYLTALQNLVKYVAETQDRPKNGEEYKLYFKDINKDFVEDYRDWLQSRFSKTHARFNLSPLRAIYNLGIGTRDANPTEYPFGKHGTKIPRANKSKRALSIDEIKRLMNYKCTSPAQQLYVDIWRFSYLCMGINVIDICLLKYGNIRGDFLVYEREKTKFHPDQEEIEVYLLPEAKEIIERHGSPLKTSNEYIFPFLKEEYTRKQLISRVHDIVRRVNHHTSKAAAACGIDMRVTSYYARHSAATTLRDTGTSPAIISKLLGHTDIKTTQSYLDSLKSNQVREAAERSRKALE
jgi:integrase